ncbi:MAG: carbohydrate-binding module family 20 domain-containing protein [Bacteroidota bacterium]
MRGRPPVGVAFVLIFQLTGASAAESGAKLNGHMQDRKPLFLNIIWHQHQPLYADPENDQLSGPWVRTHATKDYYDMAAILLKYPDIHCTINLTSSLLLQLREYYVTRIGPFVDVRKNAVDVKGFLKRWKGKTDPWIDLVLKPAERFDARDRDYLYRNAWNAFGISDVQMSRFPEYKALKDRLKASSGSRAPFTVQQMREIKFWFYLAHFDPDFLVGPVKLIDGSVCDLSDYVSFGSDSTFHLKRRITEADCVRMVAESYKVMANIIPLHQALRYDSATGNGQVEIITTPYYHPILPLIYDSDLARVCQPHDPMPSRFSYPADADAHVAKAVRMYTEIFGGPPSGMWPGEGSVAQPVLEIFRRNGIEWTASDVGVLSKSDPPAQPNTTVYRFPAGEGGWMSLVFRDTELSDRIGFTYQNSDGEEAAEDFVNSIVERAPRAGEPDCLLTVILDGENAWEWYRKDIDGKNFLNALYRKLTALQADGEVITTTTAEYIHGNPQRRIPSHPVESQFTMKNLWPGSWINANFDTWIGEPEENRAWEYLLRARRDLERSGIERPDPRSTPPGEGSAGWYVYKAWEEMYAAEGSDWFWWYGGDQSAPGGDRPFDAAFRKHLENVYLFARKAGSSIASPEFSPIIAERDGERPGQGTMAKGHRKLVTVEFRCDARAEKVDAAIYIAGNLPQLGNWTPNAVAMRDDGAGGDDVAGDGIWVYRTEIPAGTQVQYKFTNSGRRGEWVPGEEFPSRNRSFVVSRTAPMPLIITDIFGQ